MGPALEITAPGAHKLPFRVEHHGSVAALARLVDRVVDVDQPVGVLYHPVDVSVADMARQLTPIVDNFVGMFTTAGDGCRPLAGGVFRSVSRAHGRLIPAPARSSSRGR